jgi:hypothetical protein
MPSSKKATAPNGTTIEFDEAAHRYFTKLANGDEIVYTSVTSMVKSFFKPFDSEAVASKVSTSSGQTQAEVLAMWKQAGEYACTVGTRVHEVGEDVLLGLTPRNKPADEHERKLMKQVWIAATEVRTKMKVHSVEAILFDIGTEIAGTADFTAWDASGNFWILDWKTNAKLSESSRYGQRGLGVLEHLEDCDIVRYALQLSVYEYLVLKGGYVPRNTPVKRAVIHLAEDAYKIVPTKGYPIEVRDMIISANLDNVPF